jgi:hypothetical protein
MSSFDFFISLNDRENEAVNQPLISVDLNNDKELLRWLNTNMAYLKKRNQHRFGEMRRHLKTYKNDRYRENIARQGDGRYSEASALPRAIRFSVNHLYENTEAKVSFMGRMKPAVDILPTNDDVKDKYAARLAKMFLGHLWDINDIDFLMQSMHRHAYILGESYVSVLWDKDAGDLHPEYVRARDAGLIRPSKTPGKELLFDGMQSHPIPAQTKTGDVAYSVKLPWRILVQRKQCYEEAEYLFDIDHEMVDILKKEYPEKKDDIKVNQDLVMFNSDSLEDDTLFNSTLVIDFWHKKTKYFPNGMHIRFTPDTILLKEDLGYSHGKLPYLRLTDLDIPGALHGVSFYTQVAPIQIMMNNLNSIVAKALILNAHPKWIMPQGAASIESLANETTVVQYKGQVGPRLETYNPMSQNVMQYLSQLREWQRELSAMPAIMHGQNPSGVVRAQALQFLNEQANERNSTDILKHNKFIRELAKMSLAVAGDYYKPDDGRTMRIVGENGEYLIPTLDTAVLSKNYDFRINDGSAFPETKAARIERIMDAMQYNANLLPQERWADLLDLGGTEKMTTLITAALDAAESETEDILDGKEVGEPKEWEEQIIHWQTHTKGMQRREYKEKLSEDVHFNMEHHVEMHEMLMFYKAQENPTFMAQLATLPGYPIFFKIPMGTIVSAEQAQMQQQLAIQQGIPATNPVPAQPALEVEGVQ